MSGDAAIILPVILLALCGWLVPKLLSLVTPEGVKPLMVLAFLATLLMFVISAAVFLTLYVMQGVPLDVLFEPGFFATAAYLGQLGLSAAIVWAPMLILSVAGLPRNWVHETW